MKIENGMPLVLEKLIPLEEPGWRTATLGECAAEIGRLQAALKDADRLLELAGYEVLPGNARDTIRAAPKLDEA